MRESYGNGDLSVNGNGNVVNCYRNTVMAVEMAMATTLYLLQCQIQCSNGNGNEKRNGNVAMAMRKAIRKE